MEYPVLMGLELTAGNVLRWKVVSKKVPRYDVAQQAAIARLQSRAD